MTKTLTIGLNDKAHETRPKAVWLAFQHYCMQWELSNQPEQWDPPRNHDQVAIRPNGIVRIPQFMQLLSENWVLKLLNIKRVQYRIEHVFKENWPPNCYAIVICSFPVHLEGKVETIFKIQYEKNYNRSFFRKKVHLTSCIFLLYSAQMLTWIIASMFLMLFCCLSFTFWKI